MVDHFGRKKGGTCLGRNRGELVRGGRSDRTATEDGVARPAKKKRVARLNPDDKTAGHKEGVIFILWMYVYMNVGLLYAPSSWPIR